MVNSERTITLMQPAVAPPGHTRARLRLITQVFSSRRLHTRFLSDWSSDVCSSDLMGRAFVFFSSRRRHTRCLSDWSSDVCSSDLDGSRFAGLIVLVVDHGHEIV